MSATLPSNPTIQFSPPQSTLMSSRGQHINSVPEELKPFVGIVRPYRTLDPVAELYILISRYLPLPWPIFAPTTHTFSRRQSGSSCVANCLPPGVAYRCLHLIPERTHRDWAPSHWFRPIGPPLERL
jgi:hypothetical protein